MSSRPPRIPFRAELGGNALEESSYKCHACPGFKTTFMTDFHYHNRVVHKESTEFKCPICGHIVRSNTQVRDHLIRMEQTELSTCQVCRKHEICTRHEWAEHFKIHKQPAPERGQRIPCPMAPMCKKTFKLTKSVNQHVAKYHIAKQPVAVASRPGQPPVALSRIQTRGVALARVWRPWEQNRFREIEIELP